MLLDARTKQRVPYWAELDSRAPAGSARQGLLVHPAVNLTNGDRYLVALRNLKRGDGTTIEPNDVFRAYRDRLWTGVPQVEARRNDMAAIFRALGQQGIDRSDLYLAWDFTVASTRNITGRMLAMRDDAFASLGGAAPSVLGHVGDPRPRRQRVLAAHREGHPDGAQLPDR